MKIDIYENIFIGNFIYVLGVQMGIALCQHEKQFTSCINLLQQTPVDQCLADMLATFSGVSFLIEFKRENNRSLKELEKLKILRRGIKNNNEMIATSHAAHWFIQIKAPNNGNFETKVVPYLDLDQLSNLAETKLFECFIKEIVTKVFNFKENKEVINIGVTAEKMSTYIKFLCKIYSKSGLKKPGGLIITLSLNGELTYVAVNDITQMLNKHKNVVREYQQMLNRYDHELER